MAGHSKWSKVKRSKGALDVKRGALFSKLAKEISVAARMGGAEAHVHATFDVPEEVPVQIQT